MDKKNKIFENFWPTKNLPTWEEIINDLDINVKNNDLVKVLDNFGVVTHKGDRIQKIKSLQDYVHQNFAPHERFCSSHIYISLLSNSKTFGRHKDKTDVYFVLALGSMEWVVEYDEGVLSAILRPGDMIYLPKGVYHTPIPLSPRVGISIGF